MVEIFGVVFKDVIVIYVCLIVWLRQVGYVEDENFIGIVCGGIIVDIGIDIVFDFNVGDIVFCVGVVNCDVV